jgi:hypothetical protein
MPDENPTQTPAERLDEAERDVLYLLTDGEQAVWSVEDIALAMADHCAIDYVLGLHRAGLIHKTSDGYVFASRPGVRAVEMIGRVV